LNNIIQQLHTDFLILRKLESVPVSVVQVKIFYYARHRVIVLEFNLYAANFL